MPDRGDERGRGGTRTLVTGILADTEWHPATNPQEATQTAREARDLAVRLRPVLSKLAQAPRGGRRRDLDWLPAVEQLAVDAQYFASWWLPRLEGKSAQSWPSWSADGYADWVKRLDAQRLRTLEMVQGTAPVTRIASVTQLRRGKSEPEQEAETEAETAPGGNAEAETALDGLTPASGSDERAESPAHGRHGRHGSEPAEGAEEERTARITPLRGPGAALMDAAFMDVTGPEGAASGHGDEPEPSRSAAPNANVTASDSDDDADDDVSAIADNAERAGNAAAEVALPPVPRTPPNQGPVEDEPKATRVPRPPAESESLGYGDISADDAAKPQVPHSPPNQGPEDDDTGVGADILQIPRTPPNSGPANADTNAELSRKPRAPIVSLVGESDRPRVPRTPPNPGPDSAGDGLAAEKDAESTHVSLAPVGPAGAAALGAGASGLKALGPGTGSGTGTGTNTGAGTGTGATAGAGATAGTKAGTATGTGAEEKTRPLFRPDSSAPALAGAAAAAGAAGAATGASAASAATAGTKAAATSAPSAPALGAGHDVSRGMYGADAPSRHDEFENFQPGSDLPPPIFPMTEPTEPVDRGRIVRFAVAAVVLAAAGVAVFVAVTQKSSATKAASSPPSTSSASTSQPSSADSPSSSISGAVTAPTATDAPPPVSSTASKPAPPPVKPSTPPSTPPKTTAEPSHTSAAPPPVSHQPPVSGGVSSLSITSLAPDTTGGYNYVAHVHVTTNGTGTVTVMVTFAGTSASNSPGSVGSESLPFTLSGKTSYDFVAQTDVHGMCQPSQPYIDAVASASGAGSSVAYASSPC